VRGQQTSAPKPLSVGEKALVAVAVTWAAGFVDTTGYLRLSHIFTANMSGNTVRVSLGAATWNWNMAAQRFWPLVAFVTGLLISAAIHEAGHRREFTRTSAIVFGMEAMLLACFLALSRTVWAGNLQSGEPFYVCTALLGLAMGLQNATITRVGALSVKTTHITGTLTSFAEAFGGVSVLVAGSSACPLSEPLATRLPDCLATEDIPGSCSDCFFVDSVLSRRSCGCPRSAFLGQRVTGSHCRVSTAISTAGSSAADSGF
jgi:uncharacterized membrane protein YoaK (UPF0700 family)